MTPDKPEKSQSERGERVVVRVAGFWRRSLAGLVDAGIVFAVGGLWAFIVVRLLFWHRSKYSPWTQTDVLIDRLIRFDPEAVIVVTMLLVIAALYLFFFFALRSQTLGMRLLHLRLIDGYGDRLTTARALVRTAAYVPALCLLGLGVVWIAFDREKRGLHDWLAGTYVISEVQSLEGRWELAA